MNPDAKGLFLGPKGENAEQFESLILEILRDHVFWRRNFHLHDSRLISEHEKGDSDYLNLFADIKDDLFKILANLKRGAPVFSPRFAAHMVTDPTLPALAGYFAGMLYNQNNVAEEVSPDTVSEEREYIMSLMDMVGFPPLLPAKLPLDGGNAFSWGHLSSGGTLANVESLWAARNIQFYPVSLKLAGAMENELEFLHGLEVTLPDGSITLLGDSTTFQLMNLRNVDTLDLCSNVNRSLSHRTSMRDCYREQTAGLKSLGLGGFLQSYNKVFAKDPLESPRIILSHAAHYCWAKGADLLGLGREALEFIRVDQKMHMDIRELRDRIEELCEREIPVLAVISICGSTETASVDPLSQIATLREELEKSRCCTFWHHSDAAFGGFFASMIPRLEDGGFIDRGSSRSSEKDLIDAELWKNITSLSRADSISIDPHKFGFVPYPCGAVLMRDCRSREFIAFNAPYTGAKEEDGFGGFLGRWTLEGSRPGASAISCRLSQLALPLTSNHHGRLLRECMSITRTLEKRLLRAFGEVTEANLISLDDVETTAYCFFLVPETVCCVSEINRFNEAVWRKMTVDGREDINEYSFMISKTTLEGDVYSHVIRKRFAKAGLHDVEFGPGDSITILRVFIMNPFVAEWESEKNSPGFIASFAIALEDTVRAVAEEFARTKRMYFWNEEESGGPRNQAQDYSFERELEEVH